jgi:hypothetical protein
MIQQNYGKYIRDDGDALLRAYVGASKIEEEEEETETFRANVVSTRVVVVPTGIEPLRRE